MTSPNMALKFVLVFYSIASLQVTGVGEELFKPITYNLIQKFAPVDVTCFQMCKIDVKNTFPCSVCGIISFLVYYSH